MSRESMRLMWTNTRSKLDVLIRDADEALDTMEPYEAAYTFAMRLRAADMARGQLEGIAAMVLIELAYRQRLDREIDAVTRNPRKPT